MKTYLEYEGKRYPFHGHDVIKTEYGPFLDFLSDRAARTHRFFEEDFLTHLKSTYPTGISVVDIGGNIGNHSLFFNEICGWKVTAFEPIDTSYMLLTKNASNVTSYNVALGSEPGKASFGVGMMNGKDGTFSAANMGATTLEFGEGPLTVQTLDSFQLKPDLVKIDVEGMEAEVLKGSLKTFKHYHPDIWLEANKVEQLKECFDILNPLGYWIDEIFMTDNPMVRFRAK